MAFNLKIGKINSPSLGIDLHYIKTIVLLIGAIVALYLYFSTNSENNMLSEQSENNISSLTQLDGEIKKNKQKLVEFNNELIKINKEFLKPKEDFGVYKMMEHFDEFAKFFNYSYTIDLKEKNLSSRYFEHTIKFIIDYKDVKSMHNIIQLIEDRFYNSFVDGRYEKGRFQLTYKFYGEKPNTKK